MQNPQKSIPSGLMQFDQLPDSAYVRLPVLLGLFAVSSASIWRWTQNGSIPKPTKLAARTAAWNVGELRLILAAKKG
jgi:predicted DNA-binding transcriptional regulator AlpA